MKMARHETFVVIALSCDFDAIALFVLKMRIVFM